MKKSSTKDREEHDQLILTAFGQNLKKLREKRNISQEHFAYEAGFSRSYYAEIELGRRNVSLLNIVKIAAFLGVELSDLIKQKEYQSKSAKK